MAIDHLLQGYPGDEAWRAFLEALRAEAARTVDTSALAEALGDNDAAEAILLLIPDRPQAWIDSEVPALGMERPRDVTRRHPDGRTILRALLMRLPS